MYWATWRIPRHIFLSVFLLIVMNGRPINRCKHIILPQAFFVSFMDFILIFIVLGLVFPFIWL